MRVATMLMVVWLVTPTLRAADQIVLTYRTGLVQPGDVLHLAVAAPAGVAAVTGTWHSRPVPFVRDADGVWRALLGIDVDAAVGPKTLEVAATGPGVPALSSTHVIAVSPKTVRTRRIRVNPKFVIPPKSALPRIEQETALLNALFRTSRPERLWAPDAVRPVEGVAVSGFGVRSILNGQPRGPHNGLDLAAVTGTPVYAPTPGVVAFAREFYFSGNTVIVDHGQGLFSTMAHLSVIDVTEGERVIKGALLGKVGATGRVTGPHLHWAVRLHGDRVDPLKLLEALAPKR
jgi:Peptidase family M23